MNFFKKLRKNKGDADPVFFAWGIALTLFVLWFSLDLIGMTWSRYTIKREAQNVSRIYGLTWVNSVWNPDCNSSTMSTCEYANLQSSALAHDMTKIIDSAIANGNFSDMTIMISTSPTDTIADCNNALLCLTNVNGVTSVRGWSPFMVKTNIDYGTDLFLTMNATVPYRYIGARLGLEDVEYSVINKFASERFAKNDTGVAP